MSRIRSKSFFGDMMRFPRIGLLRNRADDRVIATWHYATSATDPPDIDGECPYAEFSPGAHEVVDLTGCEREEYTAIARKHHETVVTQAQGGERKFFRRGPGQTRIPHEITALDEHRHGPKQEPPSGGGSRKEQPHNE